MPHRDHAKRRRIGTHQLRKLRLERFILAHQRVIVGIRDLGRIAVVVEPVVPRNLLGQPHQPVGRLGLGHSKASASNAPLAPLLCAPGVAVTERFRWLASVVASERLGRLTLAVAQHADTGPATWREYTGDPTPFYAAGVGPVFDHGVYRLHGLTMLLGPVRRVQAMGTISSPTRLVRAGPLAGTSIPVTTPDHVLMNLEFERGALGQLTTSFAAPATLAPWMELQFEQGTISLGGESSDPEAPVRLYVDDESPLGLEGWVQDVRLPADVSTVRAGAHHFVSCLRGEAAPVLTAEHARHVLDIILKAYESIGDGLAHDTETTF